MSNVAALHTDFTGRQLDLIRHTVAKDCQPDEFNLFIAVAQRAGLDPFRRQISALVFSKDNPEKRRMSIITGIDGLRAIAARSGRYRPDENEPDFAYDPELKGPTNPLGIEKAVVKIYIRDEGGKEWRPVAGVAYWAEYAPIKEEVEGGFDWVDTGEVWPDTGKPKRRKVPRVQGAQAIAQLDTSGNWGRMPRVMLAKCAEAQALRKAFPEDLSGLYEGAEMDQARVVDLSPTEIIEAQATEDRLTRIGVANAITFQLTPASPLEPIALGKVADRVMEAYRDFDLQKARWFDSANRASLQEFWARAPADALGLKKFMEGARAKLEAGAPT